MQYCRKFLADVEDMRFSSINIPCKQVLMHHDRTEKSCTASTLRCPIHGIRKLSQGFVWDNRKYLQCTVFPSWHGGRSKVDEKSRERWVSEWNKLVMGLTRLRNEGCCSHRLDSSADSRFVRRRLCSCHQRWEPVPLWLKSVGYLNASIDIASAVMQQLGSLTTLAKRPNQRIRLFLISQISHAALVPSTVLFLSKSPLVEQYDLSSLKDVTSGAAPLGEELSKALKERLPSIEWFRQGRPRKFRFVQRERKQI